MSVKYRHGFTLGKFMPPHNGHLHLIREARKQCDFLTVLVCSLKNEPIPGALRHAWLEDIFWRDADNIDFVHVAEEVPQTPEEHPNFWPIWTDLINRHVNDADVFFSSEDYGKDVAAHIGCKSVIIDKDRKTFPVSGTMVRNDPFAMWEFLHPVMRPYFAKRIVITGAESVGKSTIINQLCKHYNAGMVPEYGREYCEVHHLEKLYPVDFIAIAKKHVEREHFITLEGHKIVFVDTDPIVTEVYSRTYSGSCPKEIVEINKTHKYDFHVLLDCDLPFVEDGTRVFLKDDQRPEYTKLLESKLTEYGAKYVKIGGVGEKRLQNAIEAIDKFLNI